MQNVLPLVLGLVIFSFSVTSLLIVPFINLLYKFRLQRRKEAPKKGVVPLFDKLHDSKAGTPIGGGILIIALVSALFYFLFPVFSHMGVFIRSAYDFKTEFYLILFTFISFGFLGMVDDIVKIFGKGRTGIKPLGIAYGLTRRQKFLAQWVLAFIISFVMYKNLQIQIVHIPIIDITLNIGYWYIPFASFIIVAFTNAFNITDGLDGLSVGLLMICLIAFGVIAGANLDTPIAIFIATWLGSLFAFLYFNIYPARLFLGDAGALSFGATLALIGLLTGSIFGLLVIGGIYVVEIISSAIQMFGWKYLKKPIFPVAPIHNSLMAIGWEEPKIVMRAWIAGIMLAIFGLWLSTI